MAAEDEPMLILSSDILGPNYRALRVAVNCDHSATWKGSGKGGAAKVCHYPCHCCPVHSDELARPNIVLCDRWCKQLHSERDNWKCYHKSFLTEDYYQQVCDDMSVLIEEIPEMMPNLDAWQESSSIRTAT